MESKENKQYEELLKEHESIDSELCKEMMQAFKNEILHPHEAHGYYKGFADAMKKAYLIFTRGSDIEDIEFLEKQEAVKSEFHRLKILMKQYEVELNE